MLSTILSAEERAELASRYVHLTGKHIFLTGRAGTGKTTLLKTIASQTHKRMAIVAPTGVAAINAGGVTIHSFFQFFPFTFLPEGSTIPQYSHSKVENAYSLLRNIRLTRERIEVLRSIDLLVVDEVSMVRCDLLDAMDTVLRRYRRSHSPFGGVQLLLIGDLYQLAPVVKNDEARILEQHYPGFYFFESQALRKAGFITMELKHVYRQSDPVFLDLLNAVRESDISPEQFSLIESRCVPAPPEDTGEGIVTLTTHVRKAERMNAHRLETLNTRELSFRAVVKGDFGEHLFPADAVLKLKEGAQVMFIKNDREKRYFNGKIGFVERYVPEDDTIIIRCPGQEVPITVSRYTWRNVQYRFDRDINTVREEEKGEFSQFPLRLAWAITIHKSQGLTFDRAVLDVEEAFAPGQVYVALSRCRTLEGLVLLRRFSRSEIGTDPGIDQFYSSQQVDDRTLEKGLEQQQLLFLEERIDRAFTFSWLPAFIRNTQEAVINYLGEMDEALIEQVKGWDELYVRLHTVSTQYRPHIHTLLGLLDEGLQPEEQIARLRKAVGWFSGELTEGFGKPVASFIRHLRRKKGSGASMKQLRFSDMAIRDALRNLAEMELLLDVFLGRENTGGLNRHLGEKLEGVYRNLQLPGDDPEIVVLRGLKKNQQRGSTKEITLQLLREGKSIRQIALERGLKAGTIASHLVHWIREGILSAGEVMPEERVEAISRELDKLPDASFSEQVLALRGRFDENDIKLLIASRRRKAEM